MATFEWIIPLDFDGFTVHRCAVQGLCLSSAQFKNAKFQGEILLDQTPVRANHIAHVGQTLHITTIDKTLPLPKPYPLPLVIAYEDDDLMVIDKPAPLPSVPTPRKVSITLENAVFSYLGEPSDFVYRPINRLDKGTSGLMVVAKTAHAQHLLQKQLHDDSFVREYLAICEGIIQTDEGVIDAPIQKVEDASIRRVVSPFGKPASTKYTVLLRTKTRTLLKLRLGSGRTHQIRVHLCHLDHPVTGDFLYGTEIPSLPERFALHSSELTLTHPLTKQTLHLVSPLPSALSDLLS